MGLRNTRDGWGWLARLLHWGMAALVLAMVALGLFMTRAFAPGDMGSYEWYQIHKSLGFTVFVLAVLRLLWRVGDAAPAAEPGKRWERALARLVHVLLYLLLFAIPLTGWLMVSSSTVQDLFGIPNRVFGLFDMPDPFVPGDQPLSDRLKGVHAALWKALGIVLALHVAGALKHHLVDRDGVLRRMVIGR
jgi:cytochrome b561